MNVVIEEMYAFTVIDDDGNEGVMAFQTQHGMMPMVGADKARINSLRPIAREIGTALEKPVTIKRFRHEPEYDEVLG